MELKEMIKVMQHYDDGGEIEFSENDFKVVLGEANEKDDGDMSWNWDTYKYRIKTQKTKVTIEKWLLKDVGSGEYFIMDSSDINLTLQEIEKWKKVKLLDTYEVEL